MVRGSAEENLHNIGTSQKCVASPFAAADEEHTRSPTGTAKIMQISNLGLCIITFGYIFQNDAKSPKRVENFEIYAFSFTQGLFSIL